MSEFKVPKGWKLVPLHDTNEMMSAAYAAADECGERVSSVIIGVIYRAMLAAAPAAPLVQAEPIRYTNDGALAECPCCGSLDVGGAHDTVNCYRCDLKVTRPRPLQNAIAAWNTRTGKQVAPPAHPDAALVEALNICISALSHGASCQRGVVETCCCGKCAIDNARAALAGKGGE